MKNILAAIVFSAGILGSVYGQGLVFSGGDTVTYTSPLTIISQTNETYNYLTYSSMTPDTVYWVPVVAKFNPGWQLSFCDPNVCNTYDTFVDIFATHSFAVKDTTVQLRFGSVPNCIPDTGVLQIHMWLKHDSATSSRVLTYVATFTGVCQTALGNPIAAQNIKIYPAPVSSELSVSGLGGLSGAQIRIYDMLGNTLVKQDVNSGQNNAVVNTSAFRPGVYIVGIEAGGNRVLTKRIEKLD